MYYSTDVRTFVTMLIDSGYFTYDNQKVLLSVKWHVLYQDLISTYQGPCVPNLVVSTANEHLKPLPTRLKMEFHFHALFAARARAAS